MEKFIAQQDETCSECGEELPKGSWCYTDDTFILCVDCHEREEFAEQYG